MQVTHRQGRKTCNKLNRLACPWAASLNYRQLTGEVKRRLTSKQRPKTPTARNRPNVMEYDL